MSLILLVLAAGAILAVWVAVAVLDRRPGRRIRARTAIVIAACGAGVAIGLVLAAGEVSS